MKFDDLDKKIRIFELAHDHCVLPGIYIVARIDGRCFTRLTKEVHKFEAPYDYSGPHKLDSLLRYNDCQKGVKNEA